MPGFEPFPLSYLLLGLCSLPSSLGVTALSAPITMCITDAFTRHITSQLLIQPLVYFRASGVPSSWCCLGLRHLPVLLTIVMSGGVTLPSITILLVWLLKSHRILVILIIFGAVVHFDPGICTEYGIPYSVQIFQYTMPATWLWHSKCPVPDFPRYPYVLFSISAISSICWWYIACKCLPLHDGLFILLLLLLIWLLLPKVFT